MAGRTRDPAPFPASSKRIRHTAGYAASQPTAHRLARRMACEECSAARGSPAAALGSGRHQQEGPAPSQRATDNGAPTGEPASAGGSGKPATGGGGGKQQQQHGGSTGTRGVDGRGPARLLAPVPTSSAGHGVGLTRSKLPPRQRQAVARQQHCPPAHPAE